MSTFKVTGGGDNLGFRRYFFVKHILMVGLLVCSTLLDYFSSIFIPAIFSSHILFSIRLLLLLTWLLLFIKWYMIPYVSIIKKIRIYYGAVDNYDGKTHTEIASSILEKIVSHYKDHEKQQEELMKQLLYKNELLDQNNKITKAMMELTNEILSSVKIDNTLQNILEKAIDIIPNAQKGSILLFNGKELEYKAVFGYDFNVLKYFKFDITESFQYKTNDFYEPIIIRDVEAFNSNLNADKFKTLKNSRSFELKSVISCAISVDGEFIGIINIDNIQDINAFKDEDKPIVKHLAEQMGVALKNAKLIEKTLYLSRHDGLTNIYNRCYFEELFDNLYTSCKQSNEQFSIVIFDINHLKVVNDTHGHDAGDKLIKDFVCSINAPANKPDIFARTGGDEFVAVYLHKDYTAADDIIKAVKANFTLSPFKYEGIELFRITFGYGIASYPADATTKYDLLRIADKRMYIDKKASKQNND